MVDTVTHVPLLDLKPQYAPIRDEVLAAIVRVCDSQRFIMGPEVEALERELAAMLEVRYAVAVSSGTDALLAAMMALGIGPGDEVVTTTYSFFATAGCISRLGARPVLVDIDPLTCNIDPAATERAITPRTRAILPVHLYGLMADMGPIAEIARRAGVPIIEDAAQAIGSRYEGRQAGSIGAFGCFSFFPSKNLGAFGDGGLVTTMDEALAHRVALIRNHGGEPKYFHKIIGANFRLDAIQAAVLRVKLRHLEEWVAARRRWAKLYYDLLCNSPVTPPIEVGNVRHVYYMYTILAPRRDELQAYLAQHGIGSQAVYPLEVPYQPAYLHMGHHPGDFPVADTQVNEILCLPMFPELTEEEVREVAGRILAFYDR